MHTLTRNVHSKLAVYPTLSVRMSVLRLFFIIVVGTEIRYWYLRFRNRNLLQSAWAGRLNQSLSLLSLSDIVVWIVTMDPAILYTVYIRNSSCETSVILKPTIILCHQRYILQTTITQKSILSRTNPSKWSEFPYTNIVSILFHVTRQKQSTLFTNSNVIIFTCQMYVA